MACLENLEGCKDLFAMHRGTGSSYCSQKIYLANSVYHTGKEKLEDSTCPGNALSFDNPPHSASRFAELNFWILFTFS